MRKFLLTVFTVVCIAASTMAQEVSQSKLWLGLSSDITSQPISEVTLLPSLLYFPIRSVAVGGTGFYWDDGQDQYKGVELKVRVYATTNTFVSGGIVTDFDTNGYLVEAGYTSFIGGRFYIEPSARYFTIDDTNRLSLAVGVGIRL